MTLPVTEQPKNLVWNETPVLAWHFLRLDQRLQYRHEGGLNGSGLDLREDSLLVLPGTILTVDPDRLVMCKYGLHGSEKARDALTYAPGPIICRVELSGRILRADDKLDASFRRVIWMADATRTLRVFAIWCAEQALLRERERGREPDERCWKAIAAAKQFLDGYVDADVLKAARTACLAARQEALEKYNSTADAAAYAAAAAAATADATTDAAADAADAAAAAAATTDAAAARQKCRDEQNVELTRMLEELKP